MTGSVQDLMRKYEDDLLHHPDVQTAAEELIGLIRRGYPDAQFDIDIGDEPLGVYITATIDVDDTYDVDPLFLDRLVEIQVEERIPIYVITVRPVERWSHEVLAAESAERVR